MDGIIFNIQRFSIHDGPGIRTTVFLKGCPLSCKWCHNPEGIQPFPQLMYSREKCINCKRCVDACAYHIHKFYDINHMVDFSKCISCGKCVDNCPTSALEIIGKKMSVDELINIIVKDEAYYRKSGGGATLSGGEPFFQPDFSLEILKECKRYGIHTTVETSGFCNTQILESSLPLVDLYLFDYKLSASQSHVQFTGVDNSVILSNLDFLRKKDANVMLRCPIIPNVNDTDAHKNKIEEISRFYNIAYEYMPYHDIWKSKFDKLN